jgi:hypothetical protein
MNARVEIDRWLNRPAGKLSSTLVFARTIITPETIVGNLRGEFGHCNKFPQKIT